MKQDFTYLTKEEAKRVSFNVLKEQKNVTISTVDKWGYPNGRIIDLAFIDEDVIYFVTFEGKPFFKELKTNRRISLTTMNSSWLQVRIKSDHSVLSKKEEVELLKKLPELKSKLFSEHLRIIKVFNGVGELFDLSGDNGFLQRSRFDFGIGKVNKPGYTINNNCIGCNACAKVCPFHAINKTEEIYHINSAKCNECGICADACPVEAVDVSKGL